jgi:hypothetical protein
VRPSSASSRVRDGGEMPEGLSATDIAHHHLKERERAGEAGARRPRDELLEILEAVLLAVVAIATAWSAYQTGRWEGRQARDYGISLKDRSLATRASTHAGQVRLYDNSAFSSWLQATVDGKPRVADLFERRFRPEYRIAFDAWMKTNPFQNPNAPPGPMFMPQYHVALDARASSLDSVATAVFDQGTHARETADKYLRNTVLLATVLFLVAVGQRFRFIKVRLSLLGLSLVLLALALYVLAIYPRA